MAYAFSSIRRAMGEEDPNQKIDIFQTQAAPGSNMRSASQGGGEDKTNLNPLTQTTGQTAGSGQATATTPMQSQDQSVGGGARAALAKKQAARMDVNDLSTITGAQTTLNQAQQDVQNEADSYMTAAKDATTTNDLDKNLGKAIKDTGNKSYQKVQNALSATFDPNSVNALDIQSDYEVEPIQKLQSAAGTRDILRRDLGDAQYSRGEADFDAMLLGQNDNFRNIRQALVGGQVGLRNEVDDLEESKTKKAQKIARKDQAADQKRYIASLEGSQADAIAAAKAKAEEINSGRNNQGLRQEIFHKNVNPYLQEQMDLAVASGDKAREYAIKNLMNGPEFSDTLMGGGYGTINQAGWQDTVDQNQYNSFDAIRSLLAGRGNVNMDVSNMTGAGQVGPAYSADKAAITNYINSAIMGGMPTAQAAAEAETAREAEKLKIQAEKEERKLNKKQTLDPQNKQTGSILIDAGDGTEDPGPKVQRKPNNTTKADEKPQTSAGSLEISSDGPGFIPTKVTAAEKKAKEEKAKKKNKKR